MVAPKQKAKTSNREAATAAPDDSEAVDRLVFATKHPLSKEIAALRSIIVGASSEITEGVKWNSPSFYCRGWFATINLRASDSLLLILHLGAKVQGAEFAGVKIKDETGLLVWLGKDRASVRFENRKAIESAKRSLPAIVRQWIAE